MEWLIQWVFLIISVVIITYWLFKPPFKHWALVFFLSGYISIFIAVILVEENILAFPVRFLADYFKTSLLYEYLVLPIVCVFFNKSTYYAGFTKSFGIALIYSLGFTMLEALFLFNTELIRYFNWSLLHTFISLVLFLLLTKYLRVFFEYTISRKKAPRPY